MRQLIVEVPQGKGKKVSAIAQRYHAINLVQLNGTNAHDDPTDVIIVHLSNRRVEQFLQELQPMADVHISLIPRGTVALQPPPTEAPQQVTDVQNLSPIEIFLQGLQSIGSWQGFLGYAAVGGIVVWVGLYTNTIYLLTASMLISPFAGPAMNTAIATARGDITLLRQSILRYFSALAVTICVAGFLTLILRQEIVTNLMVDISSISAVAIFIPFAAGAAGALQLAQSERSSLVAGGAVGMLVAASLAPPAGLVGMAAVLGRWEMMLSGLFLLILQLAGINVSAAIIFRLFGLTAKGARYDRGKSWIFPVGLGISAIALAGLLTWQFINPPILQRSSRVQRIKAVVQESVEEMATVKLVNAEINFPRPDLPGQNTLLCLLYVQRVDEVDLSESELKNRVSSQVRQAIVQGGFDVTPLVNVTVFDSVAGASKIDQSPILSPLL
jgi:uncharacterized membrane protein